MVVALDIEPRFMDSGIEIARKKKIRNLFFNQSDGCALPFKDNCFDVVLSHSVIEHTDSPLKYINETYRILKKSGILFLETPPYYSFEGAHMPRLKKPIPLQLILPRKLLFKFYVYCAKNKPHWIKGGLKGSALLTDLANGKEIRMEKVEKMTIGRLRRIIRKTDFELITEKIYYPKGFNKFPSFLVNFLRKFPPTRSFVNNTYKVFLRKK